MRGPSYTGRVLGGRYTVGELLGEGGWGAVYAAVQNDLGRHVALKVLHVDVALAAEAVSRFEREAKAAAALGHPNIVQVTDFQARPNEPPFIVMELLTGATLGAVLKRQLFLPAPRVVSIAFQMLSALDIAHRAGIVHRDVKPDNVFLVSMPGIDDFVKLLDFGIAKLSAENVAQLTGDGQMLGSPAFMSPEQVRSLPIDHRADIYSVGATMYFALAGRLPFDATNVAALLSAIMDQKPTSLSLVAPGVDPRLTAIVERALHKDPGGRFASAADMRAALEPWVTAGAGVTPVGVTPARLPATAAAAPMFGPPVPSPLRSPAGAVGSMAISGPPHSTATSPPAYMPSSSGAPAIAAAAIQPLPIGPTPPTMASPYGAPAVATSAPARAAGTSNAVVGLLVAIVALLLLGGIGAAGAVFYFARRDAAGASDGTTAGSAATNATAAASAADPPAAATTGAAAAASTATTPSSAPTATATSTRVAPAPASVDAGGGRMVTVDAGARKQWAGAVPKYGGGSFEKYDIAKSRAEIERVIPALRACYAATEFEPPDHQFTDWTLTIDSSGNVTSARRTTSHEPHPKLDPCVIRVLRTMKWEALPGGGSPRISLTARTKDNP